MTDRYLKDDSEVSAFYNRTDKTDNHALRQGTLENQFRGPNSEAVLCMLSLGA